MSDDETNTAQQAALQEYVDLMLMGEEPLSEPPVSNSSVSEKSELPGDRRSSASEVLELAPESSAKERPPKTPSTSVQESPAVKVDHADSGLAPRSQTMFVHPASKPVQAIGLEQRLVKARVQKLAERTVEFHQKKIEKRRLQENTALNPRPVAIKSEDPKPEELATPNKQSDSKTGLEQSQDRSLYDEQQRDEQWAKQLEQEYLALEQARKQEAELKQALKRKLEQQQEQQQEQQREQQRQRQVESLRLENLKKQEELQRLEQQKLVELKQRQDEEVRQAQEEQRQAAELVAEAAKSDNDKTRIHWSVNGRPIWAQEAFDCLFFEVSGLTLAVPLVELGSIYPVNEELTPLFGQADWFMGLMPVGDNNIRIVNTPKIVMPERYNPAFVDTMSYVISIHGYSWGLAVDQVREAITLQPSDVRWRSEGSKRPWLAGTVVEHMCALIDVKALAEMLDGNDKNQCQNKKMNIKTPK